MDSIRDWPCNGDKRKNVAAFAVLKEIPTFVGMTERGRGEDRGEAGKTGKGKERRREDSKGHGMTAEKPPKFLVAFKKGSVGMMIY